jgi:hypothetical protein
VIVLLTVGAVVVAAVAGVVLYQAVRPKPVTIVGTLTITSNIDGGKVCQGTKGYSDIHDGAEVVIHDSTGKVIATGELDEGVGSGVIADFARMCTFHFTVRDVPRRSSTA